MHGQQLSTSRRLNRHWQSGTKRAILVWEGFWRSLNGSVRCYYDDVNNGIRREGGAYSPPDPGFGNISSEIRISGFSYRVPAYATPTVVSDNGDAFLPISMPGVMYIDFDINPTLVQTATSIDFMICLPLDLWFNIDFNWTTPDVIAKIRAGGIIKFKVEFSLIYNPRTREDNIYGKVYLL